MNLKIRKKIGRIGKCLYPLNLSPWNKENNSPINKIDKSGTSAPNQESSTTVSTRTFEKQRRSGLGLFSRARLGEGEWEKSPSAMTEDHQAQVKHNVGSGLHWDATSMGAVDHLGRGQITLNFPSLDPSLEGSGSQTCSNHYPNQNSDYILLPSKKIFAFQVENFFCSDHS